MVGAFLALVDLGGPANAQLTSCNGFWGQLEVHDVELVEAGFDDATTTFPIVDIGINLFNPASETNVAFSITDADGQFCFEEPAAAYQLRFDISDASGRFDY